MARMNVAVKSVPVFTHEGGKAVKSNSERELRRAVMSCLLWEDTFYESGESIANRIKNLIPLVSPQKCFDIAVQARQMMNLRHVPLLIAREMSRIPSHKGMVANLLPEIIQRADELTEFLAIYWKDGKQKLSAQVKKGLATAFGKFDEYSLAKYNRDGIVKLKDVLRLVHPTPKDEAQSALWKRVLDNNLATPDTWEVSLSLCKTPSEKKDVWDRLISENKLGGLATLRNLRNMQTVGVTDSNIRKALTQMKTDRILPFRFISASRYAPKFEDVLEQAMFKNLEGSEKLLGKTVFLVDISGSMHSPVSDKSDIQRVDAACGLAMLFREICEEVEIISFDSVTHAIPNRRGFALRDAIMKSGGGSTNLGRAVDKANSVGYDRLIVISDEQSQDRVNSPLTGKLAYMINVASYQNGVGYGSWNRIDGFSESIVKYIQEIEKFNSGM